MTKTKSDSNSKGRGCRGLVGKLGLWGLFGTLVSFGTVAGLELIDNRVARTIHSYSPAIAHMGLESAASNSTESSDSIYLQRAQALESAAIAHNREGVRVVLNEYVGCDESGNQLERPVGVAVSSDIFLDNMVSGSLSTQHYDSVLSMVDSLFSDVRFSLPGNYGKAVVWEIDPGYQCRGFDVSGGSE